MRLFSRSRLLPALVLLIGANAWSAATVFNVLDYGAHNDGSAPVTEAIRSAIQAAKAAAGEPCTSRGNYARADRAGEQPGAPHRRGGHVGPRRPGSVHVGRMQGIECLTACRDRRARPGKLTITGRGVIHHHNAEWTKLGAPEPRTTYGGRPLGQNGIGLRELLELRRRSPTSCTGRSRRHPAGLIRTM